jgi:hypothetical protein
MAIRITSKEFDALRLAPGTERFARAGELGWYISDDRATAGVVFLEAGDYGIFVLQQDDDGEYRFSTMEHNFPSEAAARRHIIGWIDGAPTPLAA